MKPRFSLLTVIVAILCGRACPPASAQADAPGRTWTFRLLEGSYLVDEVLICGRPTIPQPMRGSFTLVLTGNIPPYTSYELRDISFSAGDPASGAYAVAGTGTWQVGGELVTRQEMTLDVDLTDSGNATSAKVFTNDVKTVDRAWPIVAVHLVQTDQNLLHFYSLSVLAAPVRDIWFSTGAGLTASKWQAPTNRIEAGDLGFASGRGGRSNADLVKRLGMMPPAGELAVDAVDIAPGGEVLFSLNADVFSETLGQLHHGDLLTEGGEVYRRNGELMAAFAPADTNADYGLDAVQVMSGGEIYFSITTNVVSPQIGMLFRGDVLSDQGRLVKSHQQLLSLFHPAVVDHDYGLDALYVWPGGEIWFSTEEGFNDSQLGPILAGDILSDQGFVVFHNLELVSAFAPVEDLADFGLDALYIVTDATPPAPAPKLTSAQAVNGSQSIALQWYGSGRAFQIERAGAVAGPFLPASPILADLSWLDSIAAATNPAAFYRLRQW